MTYPILFFHGESGWQPGLLQTDEHGHPNPHVRLTLLQYYAFRITFRDAFSTIHLSGQLYHQYLVDAVTKIEGNILHWIRTHQDHLRIECYQGLMDHIRREADQNDLGVGRVVILPSTFTGSPRNMHQNYQDAMSIVRKKGKPDLFITVTVNPKSPDITKPPLATPNSRRQARSCIPGIRIKNQINQRGLITKRSFWTSSCVCQYNRVPEKRASTHASPPIPCRS